MRISDWSSDVCSSDLLGVRKSSMPEPRGSWAELWGKQFCADGGKARCCPKADVRDSGPSGFRSQKRTIKSGRADFDMATSAFEQHRRERGRFQIGRAHVCTTVTNAPRG